MKRLKQGYRERERGWMGTFMRMTRNTSLRKSEPTRSLNASDEPNGKDVKTDVSSRRNGSRGPKFVVTCGFSKDQRSRPAWLDGQMGRPNELCMKASAAT